MEDLERLRKTNLKIDAVNARLDALGHMLTYSSAMNKIKPTFAGFIYDESIDITTVFQSLEMTVTLGIWHKMGMAYPLHCHHDSIEHLIIIQGSFTIQYGNESILLKKGDSIKLDIGVQHNTIPLEDESMIIAICIPPEKAYMQCGEKE